MEDLRNMKNRGTARRPLAIAAAVTIALSGLFIAAPAFADDSAGQSSDPVATTSETAEPAAPAEGESSDAPEVTSSEDTGPAETADEQLVAAAAVAAPLITFPANGQTITAPVTQISGTGLPNAGIVVEDGEGTELGTTVVDASGDWTVTGIDLGYGAHSIVVTQADDVETSSAATSAFSVVPAAPVVTSIADGQVFPYDQTPLNVSGTGIEGATVNVRIDGRGNDLRFAVTVVDGEWLVDFGGLSYGGVFTIEANQVVDGVASATTTLYFVSVPEPVDGGGDDDGGAAAPGDEEELAATGLDSFAPLAGVASALALLTAGLVLATRGRRRAEA